MIAGLCGGLNVLGVARKSVGMFIIVKMIWGTQFTFIGWKSEIPNVLKWVKESNTTKNSPASSESFICPREHSYRQTKPVYNFLRNKIILHIKQSIFCMALRNIGSKFNRCCILPESVGVYWKKILFSLGFSKSCLLSRK